MRYWTPAEDAELLRLHSQLARGETMATCAQRLSQVLGQEVTVPAAEKRLDRLRKSGRARDTVPMSVETRHPPFSDDDDDEPTIVRAPDLASDDSIARLVDYTKRSTRTLEQVCDALDMSPRRVRELAVEAQRRGYRVEMVGQHVGRPPTSESTEESVVEIAQPGDEMMFALVGDLHAGSKHCMRQQFRDFVERAYAAGVRQFLQVGDLIDGVYHHSVWEQSHRGFDEQVDALDEIVPRLPGAVWPFIQGNHDETAGEHSGIDVGRAIVESMRARGRTDFVYLGSRGAFARVRRPGERGIVVHLWHPRDKGNAYARSYVHQKKIEGYPVGMKPDILACGHHHTQSYITTRGVHAFGCGCWQGSGSSFAKSLRTAPDIGSWIVRCAATREGTIRYLQPEWVAYYERETVREVEFG